MLRAADGISGGGTAREETQNAPQHALSAGPSNVTETVFLLLFGKKNKTYTLYVCSLADLKPSGYPSCPDVSCRRCRQP